MLLDLSRLRGGIERVDRRIEPAAFDSATGDFKVVSPATLTGEVRKDGQKVRLQGKLTATLEVACSRCLEPLNVPIDLALDLLFLPATPAAGTAHGRAVAHGKDDEDDGDPVADDDLGVSYYKDDVLDLGDIVREQFYLVLPMKPLCRNDCRGLCPVCGINRNRETCTCRADWVDPRLEPLKNLRPGS
jgi:uncharacterized protein